MRNTTIELNTDIPSARHDPTDARGRRTPAALRAAERRVRAYWADPRLCAPALRPLDLGARGLPARARAAGRAR